MNSEYQTPPPIQTLVHVAKTASEDTKVAYMW